MPKYYYEVTGRGPYGWKIYSYDATGNKEIILAGESGKYNTKEAALDQAGEWMEDHDTDAELV